MSTTQNNKNAKRRPNEATLGRKVASVAMSAVLVWSLWPSNATSALAEEVAAANEAAASAEQDNAAQEQAAAEAEAQAKAEAAAAAEAEAEAQAEAERKAAEEEAAAQAQAAAEAQAEAERKAAEEEAAAQAKAEEEAKAAKEQAEREAAEAEANKQVDVWLDLSDGYISYDGQQISAPATKVTVLARDDFKFSATANNGFDLEHVMLVVDGSQTEIWPNGSGVYTISASDVAKSPTIKLETVEHQEEQADESASGNNTATAIDGNTVIADETGKTESGTTDASTPSEGTDSESGESKSESTDGSDASGEAKSDESGADAAESTDTEKTDETKTDAKADSKTDAKTDSKSDTTKKTDSATTTDSGNWLTNMLGGLFGGTNSAQTTSLYGDTSTVSDGGSYELEIGETQKVSGTSGYYHDWYSSNEAVATVTGTNTGKSSSKSTTGTITAVSAGTATITHTYQTKSTTSNWWGGSSTTYTDHSETYTVTVGSGVAVESVSISGADTVEAFSSTQLSAEVSPSGASYASLSWSSSNDEIATVDSTGKVTGARQGTATVTVVATNSDGTTATASKEITVTATATGSTEAQVYFLLDPTKDANSNDSGNWGPAYGVATVNTENATWTSGKNCFDNVDQRVVSWPNGSNVIDRSNSAWTTIFNNYKESIKTQLGVDITENDVEEISLIPAKISRNNGGSYPTHLDCNVDIKVKDISLVKYYLRDANSAQWDLKGSKSYINGNETQPSDVTSESFPETKTVNGVTYTFSGWYLDQNLTQQVTFPYTVDGAQTFYAKYVGGFQVKYDLAGGTWNNSDALMYTVGEGETVTVKKVPTREGYTFTGWTVTGLDGTTTISSGDIFTMPSGNVTITANWEAMDETYTVNYYLNGTTTKVAESKTGTDKYGTTVSESPVSIDGCTATTTEAQTIKLGTGENVINFYYCKNVTLTADSNEVTYNGAEQTAKKTDAGYTVSEPGATFSGITLEGGVGTDAGEYAYTFSDNIINKVSDDGAYIVVAANAGKLTIAQRAITVAAKGGEKQYDGTAITAEETGFSVTSGSLAAGQSAVVELSGSQTQPGTSAATVESVAVVSNGADVTKNYNITKTNGTLKVIDREAKYEITLTGNSYSGTYDGKEHEAKGVVTDKFTEDGVEYTVSGYTTTDQKAKDAGTYTNVVDVSGVKVTDPQGNDVTKQFNVKAQNGTLEIAKRSLTLTSATDSKQYDGTALTNNKVTEGGEGFVSGEGATYDVTGTQTYVGSSNNSFSYTAKSGTNLDNYNITKMEGTLTVTNRDAKYQITVEANSATATYDGAEHSATGLKTTTFVKDGQTYTVSGLTTSDPTEKNAGTYANSITGTAVVMDAANKDVTDQFSVSTVNGELKINKAQATLKSADLKQEYNGSVLTNGTTALAENSGWAKGEGVDCTFTGSQLLVGTSANAFTYAPKDGTDLNNYNITKSEGTLQVYERGTKYTVTVKANSATATYDGSEHKAEGVESYEFTVDGNKYTVSGLTTENPAKTDAGTYTNNISGTAVVKDASGNDVTSEFLVLTENGTLTINPRAVTLTSASAEKVYDGSALTNSEVKAEGFVGSDGATYTVTGAQTEVGSSKNTFGYELNSGTKADNYTIATVEGDLKVTANTNKVTVTITENSASATYDGTEHAVYGYKSITSSSDLYDVTKSVAETATDAWTAKGTNVGTYAVGISANDFKNTNTNFSNVEFVVVDGGLSISAKDITFTGETKSETYTGSEQSINGITAGAYAAGDNLAADSTLAYAATGTNVGEYAGTFTGAAKIVNAAGADVTGNYNITYAPGKLTITRAKGLELDVSNAGYDGDYDSVAHGGTATANASTGTTTISYSIDGGATWTTTAPTITDAGEVKVQVKAENPNYTNTATAEYTLKVNKVKINVSAEDNVTYDGTQKTLDAADASKGTTSGVVSGEKLTLSGATVSGTEQGTYTELAGGWTWSVAKADGSDSSKNYDIEVSATLNIGRADTLTVNDAGYSGTYDGAAHGPAATTNAASGETTIEYSTDGGASWSTEVPTITDAGTVNVQVRATNPNYENTATASYTLSVAKKTVKVYAENLDASYTGEEQSVSITAADVVSGYGVADGETLSIEGAAVSGTAAGTYETVTAGYTATVTKADGTTDSTDNYEIEVAGKLVIGKYQGTVTVTVTENSGSVTYNGNEQSVSGVASMVASTDLYDVTANVSSTKTDAWTAKGTDAGTYQLGIDANDFKNTNENFANVEFVVVDGALTIKKADVTFKTSTDSKTYDGEKLAGTVTQLDGIAAADKDAVTATATTVGPNVTNGAVENTGAINWGSAKSSNYNVTTEFGTLEIRAADTLSLDVSNAGYDGTYDGNAHGGSATANGIGTTTIEYSTDGGATWATTAPTITDAGETAVQVRATNPNYSNTATAEYTLKVGKASITVSNTQTKNYNGEVQTINAADGSITGLVTTAAGNETLVINGATVSGTDAGTYEKTFSADDASWSWSVKKADGTTDSTGNYQISVYAKLEIVSDGSLSILNANELGYSGTYDGAAHGQAATTNAKSGYTTVTYYVDGSDTGTTTYPTITDAGTHTVHVVAHNPNYANDATADYTLTVAPKAIKLYAEKTDAEYNGAAQSVSISASDTVDGYAPVSGESLSISGASVSGTNAGTYTGVSAYTWDVTKNGVSDKANYTIEVAGKLVIAKKQGEVKVTITGATQAKTYDGTAATATGYTATSDNDLYDAASSSNVRFSGTAEASRTNAGTTVMGLSSDDFSNINENFDKVTFEVTDGYVTVNKREMTLTSATASKTYDGTALTAETVTGADFAAGEGATYSDFASRTDEGSEENVFTVSLNANTSAENYIINKVNGTLTVNKREDLQITNVDALGYTGTYDAGAHGGTATTNGIGTTTVEYSTDGGNTWTTTAPTITDAGEATVKVRATNPNYSNTATAEYTLKVNQASISASNSATVTYTGSEQRLDAADGTVSGVVSGEKLTLSGAVVSGTEQGTYSTLPAYTWSVAKADGSDSSKNYTLTASATLVIEPAGNLTVNAQSVDVTYDGQAHGTAATTNASTGTTTLTYYVDGAAEGTTEFPTFTNAGEHTVRAVASNPNYSNAPEATYTIKIGQKALKVNAEDSKAYNGADQTLELTADDLVQNFGPVSGQTVSVNGAAITGKAVGEYTAVSAYTWSVADAEGNDVTANYTMDVAGKLTITQNTSKVVVTVKGNATSATYDGSDHSVSGYSVESITGSDLYTASDFGLVADAKAEASQKDAGTASMGLTSASFKNNNGNFADVEFVVTDGTVTVNKREMTLTSGSAEKAYDGTELTEHSVSGENFAAGEGAAYAYTGSQTVSGESKNTFSYTLNDGTDAKNYDIKVAYGTLKVTKAAGLALDVSNAGYNGTYDGAAHGGSATSNGIGTTTIEYSTDGGSTWTTTAPKVTNVSDSTHVNVRATNPDYEGTATAEYDLTVTAAAITVSNTQTLNYNGEEQTVDAKDGSVQGLQNGETLTLTGATVTRKDQGTTAKTFDAGEYSWSVAKADGSASTGNYTITVSASITIAADGDLRIIDANALNYSGTYDGQAHGNAAQTDAKSGVTTVTYYVDGTDAGTTTAPTITNVGKHTVRVVATNPNYANGAEATYTLEVTPKAIVLSNTATKTYNGTAQSIAIDENNVSGDQGTVAGETLTVTGASISGTDAGTYANVSAYTWDVTKNGVSDKDNYTISVSGQLTISPVSDEVTVTITGNKDSVTYDGGAHSTTGYTAVSSSDLYAADASNFSYDGAQSVSGTDAGTTAMGIQISGFANKNANFSNVKFVLAEDGSLTITPKDVTLKTNTESRAYNGQQLVGTGEVIGLVAGESVTVTGTTIGAAVTASTTNTGTIDWTNAKSANYNVTNDFGTLEITRASLEALVDVTGGTASKMYDGSAISAVVPTVSDPTNPGYTGFKVEYSTDGGKTWSTEVPSITNVSESTTVKVKVTDPAGNYDGEKVIEEKLEVTKRDVTLTSAGENFTYDGNDHKKESVTVSGSGFVGNQGVDYSDFASIKNVGTVDNTFTYTAKDGTDLNNYQVTPAYGQLTVSSGDIAKYVTVSGSDVSKTYDGIAVSAGTAVATDANGNELTVEYQKADGTWTTDPAQITATDAGTTTVNIRVSSPANYGEGNYVTGSETITISKRELTITADSAEQVYNGSALTKDGYTITAGSFAEGEGFASVTVSGTQTLVGESANTITAHQLDANTGTKDGNYTITYAAGKLTVTAPSDNTDVISKSHNGADTTFELGQTVTFNLTATNIYATAQTMTFNEKAGVTLAQSTFNNVAPGETVTTTATHVIDEADVRAGTFNNEASVSFSAGGTYTDTDDAKVEDAKPELTVTKSSTDNKSEYKLDETISYDIVVKNTGNQTVNNIKVTDPNGVLAGADADGSVTIASLEPGAEKTVKATHKVTEADLRDGSVTNAATAEGTDPSGTDVPATGETTDTTEASNAHITVAKSVTNAGTGDNGAFKLGETINFKVTVTNDGNQTVTDVKTSDLLDGAQLAEGSTDELGTLEPGASKDVNYTYTVTEADLRAGKVANTATATGSSESGDPTVTPGTKDAETEKSAPQLTVAKKSTDTKGSYALGEVINYQITVTNTGNQTVSNVKVSDPNGVLEDAAADGTVTIDSLEPGATATVNATHEVTEADLLAGKVVNTATAAGTDPEGKDVPANGETTDQTDAVNAVLSVNKSVTSTPADGIAYQVGETISYSIVVKNEGNVTVRSITVADASADSALPTTTFDLAPGQTAEFTATHTVTEAEVRNGSGEFINTATASGTAADGNKVEAEGSAKAAIKGADSKLTVKKEAAEQKVYANGEKIEYTITVTNTGNQTISNIQVTDDNADGASDLGTIDSLAPGESRTYNVTHTVTDEDMAAGQVVNTATVKGSDPDGANVPASGTDTRTLVPVNTTMLVNKSVDASTAATLKAGDVVTYTITVINTGNVTYKNVKVTDEQTGLNETIDSLAAGSSKSFTTTHTVTDEDVLNRTYTNTAKAEADPVKTVDGDRTPKAEDSATIGDGTDHTFEAIDTTLDVTKEATNRGTGENGAFQLGDVVEYKVTVKNSGNVDYTNVKVADQKTGLSETIATLAKGESREFTTGHIIDEADIAAGTYANTATARGDSVTDGKGNVHEVKGEGTETVGDGTDHPVIAPSAKLTVTKVASDTAKQYALGETISYTITVTNDGNLTVYGVQVADPNGQISGDATIAKLAPGESATVEATHTVTEDDIKAGEVVNVATTTGGTTTDPKTDPAPTPGSDTEKTGELNTELEVKKEAVNNGSGANGAFQPGDTVEYQITVTNKGNVAYTNVAVSDAQTGFSTTIASLGVGESQSFTTSHAVTQSDIVAGTYTNVATATADPIADPKGGEKTPSGSDSETIGKNADGSDSDHPMVKVDAAYEITKTSDVADGYQLKENDVVTYTVAVKNTGNVDLTDVTIADNLAGATLVDGDSAHVDTLAVGETHAAHYTYTVTQADIMAGKVHNEAAATATSPDGTTPKGNTGTTDDQTVKSSPNYKVTKTSNAATLHDDGLLREGDVVTYTVTIENTGNLTLTDVKLADHLDGAALAEGSSDTIASLAPGATFSANYIYTVKQSDVVTGQVTNTATATVTNPDSKTAIPDDADKTGTKTDDTEVTRPSLTIKKFDGGASQVAEGDKIAYSLTVTNNGNVDLTGIVITDEKTGFVSEEFDLFSGESTILDAGTYTVTRDDVVNGSVTNKATGTAVAPDASGSKNIEATPGEVTTTTQTMDPSFTINKTADKTENAAEGDVITYTITVANTGNVDLSGVNVVDELTGLNETVDSLAKGETKTFTTTYTVTQADLIAGGVENVATATATDPKGNTVNPSDPEDGKVTTKTEEVDAKLSVEKTAKNGVYGEGDDIEYTITVTNTGNVDLSSVDVYDDLAGFSKKVNIAKGETKTFTAYYTVTSDDIVNGIITNVASAEAADPSDPDKSVKGEATCVVNDTPQTDPSNPDHPSLKIMIGVDGMEDQTYIGSDLLLAPVVHPDDTTAVTLVEGRDYTVSYSGDTFNASGEGQGVTVTVTGIGNYAGTCIVGNIDSEYKADYSYKIKQRPLIVITGSATKVYDGTPLLGNSITTDGFRNGLRIGGLQGSDYVIARATGSQTLVGQSLNTYEIIWVNAKESNYYIPEGADSLGKLIVTPAATPDGGNTDGGSTDGGTDGTDDGTNDGGTDGTGTTDNRGTNNGTNNGSNNGTNDETTDTAETPANPLDAIAGALEDGYNLFTGDSGDDSELIYDENNPLGRAKETCWVHFWILIGIIATAIYGVAVWFRRTNHTRKLRRNMNDVLGAGDDPNADGSSVSNSNPAGMEA